MIICYHSPVWSLDALHCSLRITLSLCATERDAWAPLRFEWITNEARVRPEWSAGEAVKSSPATVGSQVLVGEASGCVPT